MSLTKDDGVLYHYYSNDIKGAKTYINERVKEFQDFYAEIRSMGFMLAEKNFLDKYEREFLFTLIEDTDMSFTEEDENYIMNKLEIKIKTKGE